MRTTILSEVSKINHIPKFVKFRYTAKESGEVSEVVVALGVDYLEAINKSIHTLEGLKGLLSGISLTAATELFNSHIETRDKGIGNNSLDNHGKLNNDTYASIPQLPGCKVHKEDGTVYVCGMIHSKTVIVPGNHKKVNSSEKTIAKNKIRRTLETNNWRQYILDNIRTCEQIDDTTVLLTTE
jgi:hypothetical protein